MPSVIQTNSATIIDVLNVIQTFPSKPVLSKPKRLGYFSCYYNDGNSVFCPDKSAIRYLDLPDPVSINCLQGYDQKKKYGHFKYRDTILLRWVLDNETNMKEFPSDFICSNGVMKDIMTVKCNDFDWYISATKIRGKIVLTKIETDEKQQHIDTQSENSNKSTFAGFNLQRLITKNSSEQEDNSFYGVFHSNIGSHRVLHCGWLHCVENKHELDKALNEMNFVLIKKFNADRESHSLFQSSTWWSLATLAGVNTIIRAKCEHDFRVKKIDKLKVANLINKRSQMAFVASLNMVLDFIKSTVKEENKCYHFHFNAKDKKVTGYMMSDMDENLVPTWYIDQQLPVES